MDAKIKVCDETHRSPDQIPRARILPQREAREQHFCPRQPPHRLVAAIDANALTRLGRWWKRDYSGERHVRSLLDRSQRAE
jgi:hypothetical protein